MSKRDEMSREKYFQRGHSRGKSLNAINLNHLNNNIREASRQKEIPSYTKINPSTIKPSKMTPDESFRLRARNANEKRADIILSRSNSDFANANSKSPNQVIIQLNHENKSSNNNSNNFHNSVGLGPQNPNYTGYGNFYRDNSNNNIYNQKGNYASNSKENNSSHSNNSRINSSALNNKIHRSSIDPRKSSKISPIRASFNSMEKPSKESQEKEMYRTSYNSGGTNGFSGSYDFESSKHKFYTGSNGVNRINSNNGSTGNNNNGHSHNFLVANAGLLSKSVNVDANGIGEVNYADGRSYLPNVSGKNLNGKERGHYNASHQYVLSEKKDNEYPASNNTKLTHYDKNSNCNNNDNNNPESNQVINNFTHNQFYSHQQKANNIHPSQTKYSSKSFVNQLHNNNSNNSNVYTNNQENLMQKTSNGLSSSNNNHNSQSNGKYYERYSDHYEINSKAELNTKRLQNPNLPNNSLKRRTESYSKIELQENILKNSLNNYANNNNNTNNNKENQDFNSHNSNNNNLNNTIIKKSATHERKKSVGDSRKGFNSLLDSQNPSNYSSNNLSNYGTRDSRAPPKPTHVLQKASIGKSKAGRQYDGTTKTNQDSYLIKNKVLGLDNFAIFGVFDGHGSHGHFVSNMIKLFFSEFFSKPELYLSQQMGTVNTRSSVNGNFKNNFGGMNKTNFPSSINAFNFNSNNNNNNHQHHHNFTGNSGSPWKDFQSTANSNFFSAASGLSNNFNPTSQVKEDLIYEKIKERNYAMLKNSFSLAESSISMSKYEVNFSGSTCVMLFLIENKLICANAGDSRAILVSQKGNVDVITALSRDHKPELKDEIYRINRLNGRVDRFNDNGIKTGPFRVWLKNQNYPGLAMSRSIGDLVAGSVGVICEPEIFECEINDKAKFVVIASDGIWEFLNNEKVADIVNPFYNANLDMSGAADKLVEEATKCWRREDESVDDISVVVIFFHTHG